MNRSHTWKLEGNILRKAGDWTKGRSYNSCYTVTIPHLRKAWRRPSTFANGSEGSGVPALIRVWLESISTADGLGDLHLKHYISNTSVRRFVAESC